MAIILDGNGRWAKAKGMPRNYGHVQGAKTVEVICEEAYKMGIQYLTVYAFSTENWSRPKDEVDALMKLLRNYLKTCLRTAEKNRMCVRILGDKTGLDADIRARMGFRSRICLSGHAMSKECPISCCGSWPIRNCILRRCPGRIFQKKNWKKLWKHIIKETENLAW